MFDVRVLYRNSYMKWGGVYIQRIAVHLLALGAGLEINVGKTRVAYNYIPKNIIIIHAIFR